MKDKINQIYCNDNQEVLKTFQDNSVDSFITDIPYSLCDIDALKMIKENVNNSGDFLNKKWLLPSVDMLKEFYRVLKTGSYFITTFTPRQDLQCVFYYRLLEAGFDINFSPIYWAYTSGFPKASNFSKSIQKQQKVSMEDCGEYEPFGRENRKYQTNGNPFNSNKIEETQRILKPTTPEAIYCDGLYSNSPKPAVEIIIIAQKPHNQAKYQQALTWYNERKELLDKGIKEEDLCFYTKNSSGGCNFDKTRIPCKDEKDINLQSRPNCIGKQYGGRNNDAFLNAMIKNQDCNKQPLTNGRFPANILCSDNSLDCDKNIKNGGATKRSNKKTSVFSSHPIDSVGFHDSGDLSRYFSLDAWTKKHHQELYKLSKKTLELEEDAEKISPFLFTSKPSQAEKNLGLEEFQSEKVNDGRQTEIDNAFQRGETLRQNTHPTTKPLALFNYLITMFTHENDIVVDPFCGSGATCISAVLTNRKYIGIDINQEYVDIANARIEYWKGEKEGKNKEENDNCPSLFN